jgi:RNA polymerase sigma-70 factor (ECF subfamily)
MLQVREGDAAAFEELVRRYQQRLLAVFDQLVPTREQAEDLAQEVFMRVFRARERYEPGAKFSTWLFTIANNVASNAIRTLTRRKEVNIGPSKNAANEAAPLEHMATDASGLMPTRQVDQMERAEIVRLAIDSLNDRQKMAIMLCKFEGMSYAEIAETMGLTVKAVKSLLSRARVNLKTALLPYMQEGVSPPEVS